MKPVLLLGPMLLGSLSGAATRVPTIDDMASAK